MRVYTYIDGLNLYHYLNDCLKEGDQKYKWCNVRKLAQLLVDPDDNIEKIKHFSSVPTHKPEKVNRHKAYIHTLQKLGVEIATGRFIKKTVQCKVCNARFKTHEEKEVDVLIGIEIVSDIYEYNVDKIIIVTNDTDFIPVVKFALQKHIAVTVVTPSHTRAKPYQHLADKLNNQFDILSLSLKKHIIPAIIDDTSNPYL